MVNPLLARTKTNWWKIKDQWMDTSVSCSIEFQHSSVSFALTIAVCEMESTQLTAFHKVAFCPLLSSVFADLKGLFNDNRRKESTIYLIKSLHIIVNSLLDISQAEFCITLDQLHFLKQATSIRPLWSVICLFNTVFGKLWTILEGPDNIWSGISLLTK